MKLTVNVARNTCYNCKCNWTTLKSLVMYLVIDLKKKEAITHRCLCLARPSWPSAASDWSRRPDWPLLWSTCCHRSASRGGEDRRERAGWPSLPRCPRTGCRTTRAPWTRPPCKCAPAVGWCVCLTCGGGCPRSLAWPWSRQWRKSGVWCLWTGWSVDRVW